MVPQHPRPPRFDSDDEYSRCIRDLALWAPWATFALRCAGLPPAGRFRLGEPGTFPTLLADTGMVVKFFGDRYDGLDQYAAERAAYALLPDSGVPAPRLLATGALAQDDPEWRWPFLVVSTAPGVAYGGLNLTRDDRGAVAEDLGRVVRCLHEIPLPGTGLLRDDDRRFRAHLDRRTAQAVADYRRWARLPERLCAELDGFLADTTDLVAAQRNPVFVHADLHADHLFVDPGSASMTTVIDFADAFAGDPHYELVVPHLMTFGADKTLLRRFLTAYGWPALDSDWPRRMLAWTVRHEWDVLENLIPARLDPNRLSGLDELAAILWDLDTPSLPAS